MTPDELNQATYDLDVKRFEIENQRAEADGILEREKLRIERNRMKWTALSIVGSVAVAGISIIGSAALQNSAANTQFRLKAAELVLQSDDPEVNRNKAERFKALFPHSMDKHWAEDFDWKKYVDESDDMKRELAKLLAEHQDLKERKRIIETYKALFDEDSTVLSFLARLPEEKAPVPKAAGSGAV